MKKTLLLLTYCLALAWSMGTNPGKLVEKTIDDVFYVRYHGLIVASEQAQLAVYDREEQKKLINSCRKAELPINTIFLELDDNLNWTEQKNFNRQMHNQKFKIIALITNLETAEQVISFNINNKEDSFAGISYSADIFKNNPINTLEKTKLQIARNNLETSLSVKLPAGLTTNAEEQISVLSNYTNFLILPNNHELAPVELFNLLEDANSLGYLEITTTTNKKYYPELEKTLAKQKSFQGFILNNAGQ